MPVQTRENLQSPQSNLPFLPFGSQAEPEWTVECGMVQQANRCYLPSANPKSPREDHLRPRISERAPSYSRGLWWAPRSASLPSKVGDS